MLRGHMEVILGVLLGWAIAASVVAGFRLIRPPRVISDEQRAMQEALHAATATLPHLRRGLSADSAAKTVGHLRTLTQALAGVRRDQRRARRLRDHRLHRGPHVTGGHLGQRDVVAIQTAALPAGAVAEPTHPRMGGTVEQR